ncbi:hypothetical protein X777_08984, partial [Ooceraea biroi]
DVRLRRARRIAQSILVVSSLFYVGERARLVTYLMLFRFHDCRRDGKTRNLVPPDDIVAPKSPDVALRSRMRAEGNGRWISRFVAVSTT